MDIARCANNDCLAIYLRPVKRLPFDSFCQACLIEIRKQSRLLKDPAIDDAEFECDIEGHRSDA